MASKAFITAWLKGRIQLRREGVASTTEQVAQTNQSEPAGSDGQAGGHQGHPAAIMGPAAHTVAKCWGMLADDRG